MTELELINELANAGCDTQVRRKDYRACALLLHFEGVTGFDITVLKAAVDIMANDFQRTAAGRSRVRASR